MSLTRGGRDETGKEYRVADLKESRVDGDALTWIRLLIRFLSKQRKEREYDCICVF